MSRGIFKKIKTLPTIIVAGSYAVGKTVACRIFIYNERKPQTPPTMGLDAHSCMIAGENETREFMVWDLGGQISFKSVRIGMYSQAHGIILMIDLTRKSSLEDAYRFLEEEIIPHSSPDRLHCVCIVGTKTDLMNEREVTDEDLQNFIDQVKKELEVNVLNCSTSYKDVSSIQKMFTSIAKCILVS